MGGVLGRDRLKINELPSINHNNNAASQRPEKTFQPDNFTLPKIKTATLSNEPPITARITPSAPNIKKGDSVSFQRGKPPPDTPRGTIDLNSIPPHQPPAARKPVIPASRAGSMMSRTQKLQNSISGSYAINKPREVQQNLKPTLVPPIQPTPVQQTVNAPIKYFQKEAEHQVQHSTENRNPFEDLVAKTQGLPIIVIQKLKAFPGTSRNELLSTGMVDLGGGKSIQATLPEIFVLAAAYTCTQFDAAMASRVTSKAQTSIAHAPKPPSTKLKTGKSGMSSGFIPVDIGTTTMEDSDGKVIPLVQNEKYRPEAGGDVTQAQITKPLEQILMGLTKRPYEFELIDSASPIKNGFLQVRMVSEDPAISNVIYRINLEDPNIMQPLESESTRQTNAKQPSWWKDSFGSFNERSKSAYPVEYQKKPDASFEKYMGYARKNGINPPLLITGDQDLFFIERSKKYNLGTLAYEVIDTHKGEGVSELLNKLMEVDEIIIKHDMDTLIAEGKLSSEEEKEKFMIARVESFQDFIYKSRSYVEALGTITPYEAYFIIQLNNRVAQFTAMAKDEPEKYKDLMKQLDQVSITSSIGLEKLPSVDIDFPTAWVKENPTELNKRIEIQIQNKNYVSPEILLLDIQYLKKQPIINKTAVDLRTKLFEGGVKELLDKNFSIHPDALFAYVSTLNIQEDVREIDKVSDSLIEMTKNPEWQIFIKDSNGKCKEIDSHSSLKETTIVDVIIRTKDKEVFHLQGDEGKFLEKAGIEQRMRMSSP